VWAVKDDILAAATPAIIDMAFITIIHAYITLYAGCLMRAILMSLLMPADIFLFQRHFDFRYFVTPVVITPDVAAGSFHYAAFADAAIYDIRCYARDITADMLPLLPCHMLPAVFF